MKPAALFLLAMFLAGPQFEITDERGKKPPGELGQGLHLREVAVLVAMLDGHRIERADPVVAMLKERAPLGVTSVIISRLPLSWARCRVRPVDASQDDSSTESRLQCPGEPTIFGRYGGQQSLHVGR